MSDAYYQARARRRTQRLLVAAGLLLVVACLGAGVASLFYDACTGGFDRSPRAVVGAYLEAVGRGNLPGAQECWEHEAYYELGAGCSEICLGQVLGASFEVTGVEVGPPATTAEGRANLAVRVDIVCSGDGQAHRAEIVLDSVGSDLPWRHWAIVHSTFGGSVAEPWCR
jgi:hypothetical protein